MNARTESNITSLAEKDLDASVLKAFELLKAQGFESFLVRGGKPLFGDSEREGVVMVGVNPERDDYTAFLVAVDAEYEFTAVFSKGCKFNARGDPLPFANFVQPG